LRRRSSRGGPANAGPRGRIDPQTLCRSTSEQFSRFIREEADRWSRVLKETGIKYD
jgi:hypothetical protein